MELLLDYTRPGPDELAAYYQTYVGHELLNQLVSAQAYARLVLEEEGDRLGDQGRMLLGRLADLTRRADELARRVADLGRLLREPAGGPPVAVAPLLREAAAEGKTLSRRTDIRYDVVAEDVPVPLSPHLLRRVLLELADNATRAIPSHRPGTVVFQAGAAPGGCVVSVADDGIGLAEADRKALTEPFAAGRRPGATRPGLGFFFVRQAVARWGGWLRVRSEAGTRVTLFLPTEAR